MKIEKLTPRNIIFTDNLPEWNLNLHLIQGKHRNYLIDTGLGSAHMDEIKAYLGEDKKPLVVINTHYHWDHIWGNHCFPGSVIIAHRICRGLIEEKWDEMLRDYGAFIRGDVVRCLPNYVFDDAMYFSDDKVRIFYTPGHKIDCISVLDEVDAVLNVGDNIGDTPEALVPEISTDIETYKKTLQLYKALNIEFCVSGHNEIQGKDVFLRIENLLER